MMITTTLGALLQAEPALSTICALKLSAKSAYHLKKLAALVAVETKHFSGERDTLIKTLGTKREDGNFELKPDSASFPDFVAKMNEHAAVLVTIAWAPLSLDMLGDEKVSAADLMALGPLLAEPEMNHAD